MGFATATFTAFMAVVALLYFAMPKRSRWVVLLVASYVFFFLNSEYLIAVLFGQTLATFLVGRWMSRISDKFAQPADAPAAEKKEAKASAKKAKKRALLVGIVVNIGTWLFLKYYNFFADNANVLLSLLGVELPSLGLLVPVGLSFYTLQAVAYLVDVQRGKAEADTSLPKFMLFMSYFPQILQGPIPRYNDLAHQLYEGHSFNYKNLCFGAQLILWGFIKKLVIADRLAVPVGQVFDNYLYYDGLMVFLAAAGYGLQVYTDFSGGIDIARGFSQMLGIDMAQNFNQPYFAKSIEEFWRRWHMTLGGWTRDYIFYPLSLSKRFSKIGKASRKVFGASVGKKIPPFLAMFTVFLFIGFWHGAEWRFIIYGVFNGFFITLAILLDDKYEAWKAKLHIDNDSAAWRFFQMFRTFILCSFFRFFSRSKSVSQSFAMMGSVSVGFFDWSFITDGQLLNLGLDTQNWVVLLIAIGVLLAVDIIHERGISIREEIAKQGIVARWIIYLVAFTIPLIFGIYGSGYDSSAFIYQQF